jgi:hypothetical protein
MSFVMLSIAGQSQALWILIFGDKLSNDFMQSGINVSLTSSRYIGLDNSSPLRSWAIGGYTDFKLNNKWAISMEMTVKSPTGASGLENYYSTYSIKDSLLKDKSINIETTNFSLPLYIKYKTKYVNFGVGPQFIFAYKSIKKYEATSVDNQDITIKEDSKELINKFDLGITALVEFYLSPKHPNTSMKIGLEYYHGFMPALKDYSNATNSVFLLKVGIPIAGKETVESN